MVRAANHLLVGIDARDHSTYQTMKTDLLNIVSLTIAHSAGLRVVQWLLIYKDFA